MKNTDDVTIECLKEMFRRVGLRYPNKITAKPCWYDMYSWTKEDEDDFRKWMKKHLVKRMRLTMERAEKEVAYFSLMYSWHGLHKDGCLTILGKEKKL